MTVFSEAMRGGARELALRGTAVFPGGRVYALSGADVKSVSIAEGNENGILPGDVLSASCQIALDNADGRWNPGGAARGSEPLAGAAFSLEFGVKAAGAFVYAPLGIYMCDEASADENGVTVSLTCYDTIYGRTAGAFEDRLGYPRTVSEIWAQLCGRAGYAFSGAVPGGGRIVDWPPSWGEITIRAAMGYVAAACGAFVRLNRLGDLELVKLVSAAAPVGILPEGYLSRRKLDAGFGPINALKVTTVNDREEDDLKPAEILLEPGDGADICVLQVTGNPLFVTGGAHTRALAEGMRAELMGLKYAACRFVWRGDPTLLIGAGLQVKGADGGLTACTLSRQTMRFDSGGFSAECVSGVPEALQAAREIAPAGGVKAGQIIGVVRGANIAASAITASKIAAGAVEADKIVAGAVTAPKIAAGAVTANAIDAAAVTAIKIAAGAVKADKIAAGAVEAGKIAAGAVTAEKIQAGSIESDHIQAKAVTAGKLAAEAVEAQHIKAKAITADQLAAGVIAAGSGLIGNAAIISSMIGEAQIVAAHIQSINADVITAGTLSVARLLLVGAGGVVHEINAQAAGLTATELSQEQYRKQLSGKALVARSITADRIAAGTITGNEILANTIKAAHINVADLFAAAATISVLKVATVGSLINGSVLELNHLRAIFRTPEFLVEIPGAEEGEEKLRINAEGLFAPSVESPTVAKRHPGGVYRIGIGYDYDTLADAFGDLEGAVLDGPVALKLGQNDPGGALRGVRGGHDVTITSGNLIERYAISANYAALSWDDTYNYKITATSAGTYRYVRVPIGRIGDLGLAGKTLSVGVGAITNYGGTLMAVALNMYDGDYQSNPSYLREINAQNTAVSVVIPSDADDDRTLALVLYVSGATSCAQGAYVVYDRIRVEIGETNTMFSWPTAKYNIADFEAAGCDRVHMARVSLPTGARIRDSDFVISRSDLYGEVGVLADMARVRMHNNKGNCAKAVKARCAQVYVTGPAPGGAYEGWLIDTTTAQISGSGSAGNEQTKTLTANATGTYGPSSWWSSDRAIRQGYTPSNGRMRGGMWWDFTAIPAGAAVMGMRLTLKRTSGFGKGDNVTLKAYGTASNPRSGQPALTMGPYTLGAINNGQTKTFDLPAALASALAAGTAKGIVLYADDTSVLSGKSYSTNYCRIDGTDGTAPKLAVTFTV